MDQNRISRVRHELKRRNLTVAALQSLTPRMLRVVLEGDDLADFVSLGYDDHVKLIFPAPVPLAEGERPPMREFTPRAFDPAARTLTIDFALHDGGLAMDWVETAATGTTLAVGGPRGSMVVADEFDWYLLVGDESALPAIARRLEELGPDAVALVVIAVAGPEEEIPLRSAARTQVIWVHRPLKAGNDPAPVIAALGEMALPPGEGYCWAAAEHSVAKAVRAHLVERPEVRPEWLKVAAYWRMGQADAHEAIT